jgi:ubiquitin-protein ligase
MVTPIYHVNFDDMGNIFLNILTFPEVGPDGIKKGGYKISVNLIEIAMHLYLILETPDVECFLL